MDRNRGALIERLTRDLGKARVAVEEARQKLIDYARSVRL
ncbi:hypothetical protein WCLP8_4180011 [uncultured Gammaproteobacteria bacterium]